jgi:hypothetical protein
LRRPTQRRLASGGAASLGGLAMDAREHEQGRYGCKNYFHLPS